MKLYLVEVQHSVYVLAKDEQSAEDEARRGIREYGDEPLINATEAQGGPIDPEWLTSLPFGPAEGRTVGEILGVDAKS